MSWNQNQNLEICVPEYGKIPAIPTLRLGTKSWNPVVVTTLCVGQLADIPIETREGGTLGMAILSVQ